MEQASLEAILLNVAPRLHAEQVTRHSETEWFVLLEDGSRIDMELDKQVPRLVLSADIGSIPRENRDVFMEQLLAYNYLWNVHGGLYLALDGVRKQIVLMLPLPLQEVTVPFLTNVLANFHGSIQVWRGAVMSFPENGEHDGINADDALISGALRV